jgi:hypothetical protein
MLRHPRQPDLYLIELKDLHQNRAAHPAAEHLAADMEALEAVVAWAREYLCAPHPELGRPGPVCPYVPTALQEGSFFLTVQRGSDLSPKDIEEKLAVLRDWFRELPAPGRSGAIFKTILCLFPDLQAEHLRSLIEDSQERLKPSYVEQGLMIGEFHPGPPQAAGLWNPDFRPLKSPIPMLVIRHMVPTDLAFLRADRQLFSLYLQRFRGNIPAHLQELVAAAAAEYGLPVADSTELEQLDPGVELDDEAVPPLTLESDESDRLCAVALDGAESI